MGETADRIVGEIEDARHDLDRDITSFEARLHEETDWKVHAGRHPLTVLGLAFVLGVLISRVIRI